LLNDDFGFSFEVTAADTTVIQHFVEPVQVSRGSGKKIPLSPTSDSNVLSNVLCKTSDAQTTVFAMTRFLLGISPNRLSARKRKTSSALQAVTVNQRACRAHADVGVSLVSAQSGVKTVGLHAKKNQSIQKTAAEMKDATLWRLQQRVLKAEAEQSRL
jgi:hypothetical protein